MAGRHFFYRSKLEGIGEGGLFPKNSVEWHIAKKRGKAYGKRNPGEAGGL